MAFSDFGLTNRLGAVVLLEASTHFLKCRTGQRWCLVLSALNSAGMTTLGGVRVRVSFLYKNPGRTAIVTFLFPWANAIDVLSSAVNSETLLADARAVRNSVFQKRSCRLILSRLNLSVPRNCRTFLRDHCGTIRLLGGFVMN